jgi:hypothetical protein
VTDIAAIEQCADLYYPSKVCNVWFDRATKKRRFVEELLEDSNGSLHYLTRSDMTDHNNNTSDSRNKKRNRTQSYDGNSEAVTFKNVKWVPCSSYKPHLTIPTNDCPSSYAFSPAVSILSITPTNEPDVLLCLQDGCPMTFQGIYRRGRRQRHMRLKHGRVGEGREGIPLRGLWRRQSL